MAYRRHVRIRTHVLKNPSPPSEICHIYGLQLRFKNSPELLSVR